MLIVFESVTLPCLLSSAQGLDPKKEGEGLKSEAWGGKNSLPIRGALLSRVRWSLLLLLSCPSQFVVISSSFPVAMLEYQSTRHLLFLCTALYMLT